MRRVADRWPLQRALLGGARVRRRCRAPARSASAAPEYVVVLVSEHFDGVPWLERVYQAGACGTPPRWATAADVHCYTPAEFERKREQLPSSARSPSAASSCCPARRLSRPRRPGVASTRAPTTADGPHRPARRAARAAAAPPPSPLVGPRPRPPPGRWRTLTASRPLDPADRDRDRDGLTTSTEWRSGTHPAAPTPTATGAPTPPRTATATGWPTAPSCSRRTDPGRRDSDRDRRRDGREDADRDGLATRRAALGFDPRQRDSDGDGVRDGGERAGRSSRRRRGERASCSRSSPAARLDARSDPDAARGLRAGATTADDDVLGRRRRLAEDVGGRRRRGGRATRPRPADDV